jgi:c-di-GMP-binding flagellar brake protein YcgR
MTMPNHLSALTPSTKSDDAANTYPRVERRRDVRANISLPVSIVRAGQVDFVKMVDASFRGVLLRMKEAPPVNQLVKLRVRLPIGENEIHGVVVRIADDMTSGLKSVGVRFFALNGQERSEWESFIASVIQVRFPRAA